MTRYRDLGLRVGLLPPGPLNAITDVDGVTVGMTTLIEGEGPLDVGKGPVRTGVTAIVPHPGIGDEPLFAGCHTAEWQRRDDRSALGRGVRHVDLADCLDQHP